MPILKTRITAYGFGGEIFKSFEGYIDLPQEAIKDFILPPNYMFSYPDEIPESVLKHFNVMVAPPENKSEPVKEKRKYVH